MGKTIIVKGKPYKMKFRPDPITRLCKFTDFRKPLPMVGHPDEAREARDWDEWCLAVYRANMDAKRGIGAVVPRSRRQGLWLWDS